LGASVWPDEWRRGNKWDGEAREGSRRDQAGRWAALSPDPLPTPPLRPKLPGGCFFPPRCPQPLKDCSQGTPQTHGSPGVVGQGERGQVWRGKAGWCWACGLLEARGVKDGHLQGASSSKARTGRGAWHATERSRVRRCSRGTCLAWLGASTSPSTGSEQEQPAPKGEAGAVQEKEDLILPHRGAEDSPGTGWAACGGESCMAYLLGQTTTPPPLMVERSSFLWCKLLLILPQWDMVLMGTKGELHIKKQPWSCQGAQALHSPEARYWGVLGTWGPMGHSRCQPTWLCGKHIMLEIPSSSSASGAGRGVGDLMQAAWLSPSQRFLHLVLNGAGVQPRSHPRNTCRTHERCSFADKVITRSPSLKLELIKIELEIEATALQLPRRGEKEVAFDGTATSPSACCHQVLAEATRCREGTRAAQQPPPPWWQSTDGCSCPGTRCLRRVGRRWAGRAARKSQPGPAARGADGAVGRGTKTPPCVGWEPGRWHGSPPAPTGSAGTGRWLGEGGPHTQPPPSKDGCPRSCMGASIASASIYAPSAAVGRRMSESWLHLSRW